MVRNREEAAQAAEATHTNVPDACQAQTRAWFDVPSVGDFDGDGAADAEDGWKSEPEKYKHHGDRNPPRGTPVSYLGGSHDNGHRAMSLGNGKIRSTDAGGRGRVATVPLDWPEKNWGLTYAGWSETMDGLTIPLPPPPPPPTRGGKVDTAIHKLNNASAKPGSVRAKLIAHAIKVLTKIPQRHPKR